MPKLFPEETCRRVTVKVDHQRANRIILFASIFRSFVRRLCNPRGQCMFAHFCESDLRVRSNCIGNRVQMGRKPAAFGGGFSKRYPVNGGRKNAWPRKVWRPIHFVVRAWMTNFPKRGRYGTALANARGQSPR